jgi:hypothetical protein
MKFKTLIFLIFSFFPLYSMQSIKKSGSVSDSLHTYITSLYQEKYISAQTYTLFLVSDHTFLLSHLKEYQDAFTRDKGCYLTQSLPLCFTQILSDALLMFYGYCFAEKYYATIIRLYLSVLKECSVLTPEEYTTINTLDDGLFVECCRVYRIPLSIFVKALLTQVYAESLETLFTLISLHPRHLLKN